MKIFSLILMALMTFSAEASFDFKENPVVYGISPRFISNGYSLKGLKTIERRLPEIAELGVNIIWLQPITPPFEEDGHGYDVVDYKSVWDVLGSEADLKSLVHASHKKNIKVMLDVVLNHSSEEHPWVKDIKRLGKKSKYYQYYQHEPKVKIPYAQHFHKKVIGNTDFIYYFWEHLLNFNYDNAELRTYMMDVLTFWVKEFDIDGFRFDASWGPSSRRPTFYAEIAETLRAIKPEIILMAEDMAGYPVNYENSGHPHLKNSDFDWAYDWNNQDRFWISKWSFQRSDEQSETIFNEEDPEVATEMFLTSVSYTDKIGPIKAVRYIENNDTPGFLLNHTVEQSMFAAKVMFVLPGVPLIFYGQEAGNTHELFNLPSFDPQRKMSSYNPQLWQFYKRIVALRRSSSALSNGSLEQMLKTSDTSVSFFRKSNNETLRIDIDFRKLQVRVNNQLI